MFSCAGTEAAASAARRSPTIMINELMARSLLQQHLRATLQKVPE